MRGILLGLIVAAAAAGCGPEAPKRADSDDVVAEADDPGALWPLMLQHCMRSPSCDPRDDFGQGAGQASGVAGRVAWFAEAADVVKEGGKDYGAAITLSLYGTSGNGGDAGRPLTVDEAPDSLRGADARRSTLSIEYRTPGGGTPEPYFLAFHSPQIALKVPGIATAKTREAMANATSAFVEGMKWPDGEGGAKIVIDGKSKRLFAGHSWGLAAADYLEDEIAVQRGFEPWVFYVPQNIRDEPVPKLLAAIEAGETLMVKIHAPDGEAMLGDAIYTGGYAEALREATEALADPELKKPIEERCKRFDGKPDEFWKIADVTAALRVCDPRTPVQRERDQQALPLRITEACGI